VPNIEPAGETLYVRLSTRFPDGWQTTSATYTLFEASSLGGVHVRRRLPPPAGPPPARQFWDFATPTPGPGCSWGVGSRGGALSAMRHALSARRHALSANRRGAEEHTQNLRPSEVGSQWSGAGSRRQRGMTNMEAERCGILKWGRDAAFPMSPDPVASIGSAAWPSCTGRRLRQARCPLAGLLKHVQCPAVQQLACLRQADPAFLHQVQDIGNRPA